MPKKQEVFRDYACGGLLRMSIASLLVHVSRVAELLVLGDILGVGLDLLVDALVCRQSHCGMSMELRCEKNAEEYTHKHRSR